MSIATQITVNGKEYNLVGRFPTVGDLVQILLDEVQLLRGRMVQLEERMQAMEVAAKAGEGKKA